MKESLFHWEKKVKMANSSISGLTHPLSVFPLVTSGIRHRVIPSGNEGVKDDQRSLNQRTTVSKT